MTFIPSFVVAAAGLEAQKLRMDLTTANLANAQTTRGPDGTAYRRVVPVFEAAPLEFAGELDKVMGNEMKTIKLVSIEQDQSPLKRVYDPSHPDSDSNGFVEMPNVNMMQEMSDMLLASRAYESNVTAFNTTKNMMLKLLDISKV